MRVNDKKTNMICVSPSTSDCQAYLVTSDGVRIESSSTLKLLGFQFDGRPSPHAQVDSMVSKFRSRLWSLRYLKRSGMGDGDLCRAYTTYLRPVFEYGSVPIHSMLTIDQSETIDRQQIRALKLIYGFDKSTDQVLELSGLDRLSLRRGKAVDRFALKLVNSDRFEHLFPERPSAQCRSRGSRKYEEQNARTERLFNSPIFYMRRRLNELESVPKTVLKNKGPSIEDQNVRCDFLYDEWR